MMNAQSWRSPNHDGRDPAIPIQYIVLHYTGMKTALDALIRLCDPQAKVSAHYVIDEDGTIYHLVDDRRRAWHAGQSYWRGTRDMNSASIGIELVNPGHEHGYRAFPLAQINALKKRLHALVEEHGLIAETGLLAHSDIAPDRKEDPGELFPWQELAREGLGLWPQPQKSDSCPGDILSLQNNFCQIGYACSVTGQLDSTTRQVIRAFQRRFYPECITGTFDPETIQRIVAVFTHIKRLYNPEPST